MAVATRFWFFLALVLLSFTISEARTFTLTTYFSKERNGGSLIEKARKILEESTQKHNMQELSTRYKINRRSPGGPDPRHH
ncbi:hypothetical protein HanIR_Chr10g0485451 [Helianthus annuus]|nr:hypothetical protein HanIR_Chr10g0485451 [Helianthus annuus]